MKKQENVAATTKNAKNVNVNGVNVLLNEGERVVWTYADYQHAYNTKKEAREARKAHFGDQYSSEEMDTLIPIHREIWAGDTPVCDFTDRMARNHHRRNGEMRDVLSVSKKITDLFDNLCFSVKKIEIESTEKIKMVVDDIQNNYIPEDLEGEYPQYVVMVVEITYNTVSIYTYNVVSGNRYVNVDGDFKKLPSDVTAYYDELGDPDKGRENAILIALDDLKEKFENWK